MTVSVAIEAGLPTGSPLSAADLDEGRAGRRLFRKGELEFWIPVSALILMAVACFLGPIVLPLHDPNQSIITASNLRPFSPGHLLGTDLIGRDQLSRALYGGRVSFEVGFGAEALGVAVGSFIGMVAAYEGGVIESVIMRIMDMIISFPALVVAITIATYLGPSEAHVIWAISFFTVPSMTRLSRAQVLVLRELDFIKAAKVFGQPRRTMLVRHLAPNVYPNLLTFMIIGVGYAIVAEAGLSFLGLGIPATRASWGNMMSQGQPYLLNNPYLIIVPACFLFVTVLCLNLSGDAIRVRMARR